MRFACEGERFAVPRESCESTWSDSIAALVKTMFGVEQLLSLADLVQAALMLRKNERVVG